MKYLLALFLLIHNPSWCLETEGGPQALGNVTGTLGVANGGTGATSLTDGGIILGTGIGALTATAVLTNGQLLIGDGTTAPTAATLTGTGAEVDVTNAAGSITLGLPDSITIVSTLTVTGNAFSVGASTLVVASGRVGIGTASPGTNLHVASGVITANGTGSGIVIDKDTDAVLRCGTGNYTTGCMARSFNTWAAFGIFDSQLNALANGATGRNIYGEGGSGLSISNAVDYGFSSTADAAGAQDANLSRISAGVVGVGTGAAGSTAGTLNGVLRPFVRTQAQLDLITPVVGDMYICSNCSAAYSICVGTAAVVSGFRRSDSTTIGCGSGN